jgi:hypothetical protein
MAKPERRRIAWVVFKYQVAPASGHSRVTALATEENVSLFLDKVDGETIISVEGPAFAVPGVIPWGNVASCAFT